MIKPIKLLALLVVAILTAGNAIAHTDTLRVMAYNVLYYGNGCQGPTANYHSYLKTIVSYANPDILSLEKVASIPVSADDKHGAAPPGFIDSILNNALNAAFPARYTYCPFTNNARANNMSLVFYDRSKLTYAGLVSSYINGTDVNTYKLYYKDPALATTHDTTFLYVTPNHDKSGDDFEEVRGLQIEGEVNALKHHFKKLANHIVLGDFNVRNSDEAFYHILTATDDTDFRFYDPPFFPDRILHYPANWDHDNKFAAYFTTSTRESATVPNSCGSGGGGKNWYDHIFLSSWLLNNSNYIKYIPNSYRTIGNDGQRFKVAINNSNTHINTSAPAYVIDALYHMSNKYPVMAELEVTSNTKGISPADPEVSFTDVVEKDDVIINGFKTTNDVQYLDITFPPSLVGQEITIECIDKTDNTIAKSKKLILDETHVSVKCNKLTNSHYLIKISGRHNLILEKEIAR